MPLGRPRRSIAEGCPCRIARSNATASAQPSGSLSRTHFHPALLWKGQPRQADFTIPVHPRSAKYDWQSARVQPRSSSGNTLRR